MARRKAPGSGNPNWQPGQSGNPKGRTPVPEDVKAIRELNSFEFARLLNQYLYMTVEQIKNEAKNPETPILNLMLAKVISKALNDGDQYRLNFLLERIIGRVPTPIQAKVDPELLSAIQALEGKSDQELVEIVQGIARK